jgi:2',3'-cyclic-nucleotide 2'-phosphodiesterase/3'-nucleotidase
LARRGSWIQGVRENRRESLLLDCGDLFFDRYRKAIRAEDVTAGSEKARLILKCYNLLGYDALGIGDDDLSLGKDFLVELSKNAGFPFISSNLMDKETGEPLFKTHVIKETGGLRIRIFIFSPVFLFRQVKSKNMEWCFASREEAKSILEKLRPKTDVVDPQSSRLHGGH